MCIKIVRLKEEVSYDMSVPLEEQLRGSKQVIINYEPKDPSIDRFLDEMERLCKKGISASVNIKFNHNNNLLGAKIRNKISKLSEDLDINELIKIITITQAETDKKLEEITKLCFAK